MRAVKIAALKDGLSATLRAVQRGESVVVTDRDRPVATLSPILDDDGVTVLPPTRPFASLRRRRYAKTRRRVDSTAWLAAERGDR